MADEQIRFYYTDNELPEIENGAIIISERDEENQYADMHIDWGNQRYLLKPSYDWTEIENRPTDFNPVTHNNDGLMKAEDKIIFDYFNIVKTEDNGETVFTIGAAENISPEESSEENVV